MVRAGLRQIDLAKVLDITQQSMSARLNGRVDFTITELELVAERIGVPLTAFLEVPATAQQAEVAAS